MPTTAKEDPTTVAKNLATFVKDNLLDGVHIFWIDNRALLEGKG